jgi:hypothetical protein
MDFLAHYLAEHKASLPHRVRWLEALSGGGAEQEIIKGWCENTPIPFTERGTPYSMAEIYNRYNRHDRPEEVSPCKEWEARLIQIADMFTDFWELSDWETASKDARLLHGSIVAKLARELANALEEEPRPYYPPVLEFFDEDRSTDIIKAMPEATANALLRGTKKGGNPGVFNTQTGDPIYTSASHNLARRFDFPEPQKLPSLLRRLADYATEKIQEEKRVARPMWAIPMRAPLR